MAWFGRGKQEQEESGGGWFRKFRNALAKTKKVLQTDIGDLLRGKKGRLVDDEFLTELFAILVKTDMGVTAATQIRERFRTEFRGRVMEMDELIQTVKQELRTLMEQEQVPLQTAESGPTVIMVVGVNGSGKTTSIAKLAYLLKDQGYSVILGAGDTFRAAAVEQLAIWADRLGVSIVRGEDGGDPASVAHRAVAEAIDKNLDICILDTAGRLQTQVNLMKQLEKIRRVISKQLPDAPHEVLLVLDATAGQNGLSQARGFSEAAGCSGIVLAKLDGTAKGGVVVPIREQFHLPVKFIGLGEKPEDLAVFDVDQFLDDLFDEAA